MPHRELPRLDLSGDDPIPADELRAGYFAWNDETVYVAGHYAIFGSRSSAPLKSRTELAATPEKGAAELVVCAFDEAPDGKVERSAVMVVAGEARRYFSRSNQVELADCRLVSTDATLDADVDPYHAGPPPIPAQALHDAMFGHQGETVQVVGRYHSKTYSSASDTTRVDLQGASGEKAVGCKASGKGWVPESASQEREGVVVEGTIGEPSFDQVILTGCRIVNRS